jgi:hypothetical protein
VKGSNVFKEDGKEVLDFQAAMTRLCLELKGQHRGFRFLALDIVCAPHTELAHLALESTGSHSEQGGRATVAVDTAATNLERLLNGAARASIECLCRLSGMPDSRRGSGTKVGEVQFSALRQDQSALKGIREFSNVAWPRASEKLV